MKSKDQQLLEEAYILIAENSEEESLLNQYEFGNLTEQERTGYSIFTIDIRKKETGAIATVMLNNDADAWIKFSFHGVKDCNGFGSESECQEEFKRLFELISPNLMYSKLVHKPVKYIPVSKFREKPMETRACSKCGFMIPRDRQNHSGWPWECPSCGSSLALWREVPATAGGTVRHMSR